MQNKMKQKTTTLLRTLCATLLLLGATLPMRAGVIWDPTDISSIGGGDVVVISNKNGGDREILNDIEVHDGGCLVILPGVRVQSSGNLNIESAGTVYVIGQLYTDGSIDNVGTIYVPAGIVLAFKEINNYGGAIHCLKGGTQNIFSHISVFGDVQDDLDVSTIYTFKKFDGVPADAEHNYEGYRDYYEAGLTFGDETIYLGQYFDLNLMSGRYEMITDLNDWKTRGEGVETYMEDFRADKIDVLEALAAKLGIGEDVYGEYEEAIGESLHFNYIDKILTEGERAVVLAYVTGLDTEHPDDIDLEYFAAAIAEASMDQLAGIIDEINVSTDLVRQKSDAVINLDGKFSKLKNKYLDFYTMYQDMVDDVRETCMTRISAAQSGYKLDKAVTQNEDDFDLLDDKAYYVTSLYRLHARIDDYDPTDDVAAIVAATSTQDAVDIYRQTTETYALAVKKLDFKVELQNLAAQCGYTLTEEELQSIDGASDDYGLQLAYEALCIKIIGDNAITVGSNKIPIVDAGRDRYAVLNGYAFLEDGLIYINDRDVEVEYLTYARTFANTNWQPLYVPFSLSYDDWKEGYDVAAINNFHEYTDADGELTSVELEVRFVTSGTLLPNHPYLIRAHEGSNEEQRFELNNRILSPSVENSIYCSSVERTYTFTGTYFSKTGLKTMGAIFMSGGKLCMAADDDVALKGQRWYLTVEDRDPQVIDDAASARPVSYTIRVTGEGADDATSIGVITTPIPDAADILAPAGLYNLQGQRVSDDYRGLVIENGRKVYRK